MPMCAAVPMPELPMLSSPGLVLASASTSAKVFGANDGEPTTTSGIAVLWISGVKSLIGSYGTFSRRLGLIA